MKQTTVEWLQDCLNIHFSFEQKMQFEGLFQQAKEMEKRQIIDAYHKGCADQLSVYPDAEYNPEQYYDETFNKTNDEV